MSTLLSALRTDDMTTTNGMTSSSSSLNNCVNLFFQIGAMRGKDKQTLINAFVKAFSEEPLTAMKLLFWARDIRGGAGERQIFKDIIQYLAKTKTETLGKNLSLIPEYGRWDDMLILIGTPLENEALGLIKKGLVDANGLCAKWMPRPNVGNRERKKQANVIRKFLGLTPKEYRTYLVALSNTVEQLMCSKNWSSIQYDKLPSKAMSDYMKAFSKNDLQRFQDYLASVERGEAKINAGAVYPYDIIKNLKQGNNQGANVQWDALPNYMANNKERVLPLVDVSSSMNKPAGGNPNLLCMDVAISLGLYICERNIGAFKDAFITFDVNPTLEVVSGSLSERHIQMRSAHWGGNTNLEAAYKLILDRAVAMRVPQDEMPTMMIILSDMQFDSAVRARGWGESRSDWNPSAQQMIEQMYANAGYEVPKTVYWNLNADNGDFPVSFDKQGTCLVSGFSPALLSSLLGGEDLTPISMMYKVVNSERYAPITV